MNSTGSLLDDLNKQDQENTLQLEENVPAYILARDEQLNGWLSIYYMPESNVAQFNKVSIPAPPLIAITKQYCYAARMKMVYSTTRNALTKSLGASLFTGSPEVSSLTDFASSYNEYIKAKNDTSGAPMTSMEREMAEIRAAEREAARGGGSGAGGYVGGSSAIQSHIAGTTVGMKWAPDVEEAVRELGEGEGSRLVVIVSTCKYLCRG